jgi:hypothetical protein
MPDFNLSFGPIDIPNVVVLIFGLIFGLMLALAAALYSYMRLTVFKLNLDNWRQQRRMKKAARHLGFSCVVAKSKYGNYRFNKLYISLRNEEFVASVYAVNHYEIEEAGKVYLKQESLDYANENITADALFEYFSKLETICDNLDVNPSLAADALALRLESQDWFGRKIVYHYSTEDCLKLLGFSDLAYEDLEKLILLRIPTKDLIERDRSVPIALLQELYSI